MAYEIMGHKNEDIDNLILIVNDKYMFEQKTDQNETDQIVTIDMNKYQEINPIQNIDVGYSLKSDSINECYTVYSYTYAPGLNY